MTTLDNTYMEGYRAYYANVSKRMNPHEKGSRAWAKWATGWLAAEAEDSKLIRNADRE